MTTYTCIACHETIQPGNTVIVGLDISDFPAQLPTNVVAHTGCEDRARNIVARELERKAQSTQTR